MYNPPDTVVTPELATPKFKDVLGDTIEPDVYFNDKWVRTSNTLLTFSAHLNGVLPTLQPRTTPFITKEA